MQTKIGRFSYLPKQGSQSLADQDSNRLEYQQIISQLSREHHPKIEQPLVHQPLPKRNYSPVGPLLQLNPDNNNRHIRSILLNESINPKARQESNQKKKDTYKIIKDSHVVSDQELISFYQPKNNTKYSPSPIKQLPPHKEQERQEPIIKFYQVRQNQNMKQSRKIMAKGNRPYLMRTPFTHIPEKDHKNINPEAKRTTTPPKTSEISESRLAKSNYAYKGKSQQRIFEASQAQKHQHHPPPPPAVWKRSCFDYVPQDMKAKLKSQQLGPF